MSRIGLKGSNRKGFTILELMITMFIIAILVALAYPSYIQYVRKAKRGDAQQLLMNWSVNQEIFRSNNPTYAKSTDLAPPTLDNFTLSVDDTEITNFPNRYTLTATAAGDQANDEEDGQPCNVMTLNHNGEKTPIECWGGSS